MTSIWVDVIYRVSSTKGPKLLCGSANEDQIAEVASVGTKKSPNSLGKRAAETVAPVIDVDVVETIGSMPKKSKLVRVKLEADDCGSGSSVVCAAYCSSLLSFPFVLFWYFN